MSDVDFRKYALDWPIYCLYGLRAGRVVAVSAGNASTPSQIAEFYEPSLELSLPAELARVNRPRKILRGQTVVQARARELLAFIHTFGALGQVPQSKQARRTAGKQQERDLEDAAWCLAHASTMDTALTLAGYVVNCDSDAISDQLAALRAAQDSRGGLVVAVGRDTAQVSLPLEGADPTAIAWSVVQALIEPNLRGRRTLVGGNSGTRFSTLFSLAYWLLADWIDRGRLRRCKDCQTYFELTDERQRYCPPIRGATESRCAMRDRTRRRRGRTSESLVNLSAHEALIREVPSALPDVLEPALSVHDPNLLIHLDAL